MNKSLILRRHTCIQVDKKENEISEVRDDIEIGERSDIISTRQLRSIDNFPDVKKKCDDILYLYYNNMQSKH